MRLMIVVPLCLMFLLLPLQLFGSLGVSTQETTLEIIVPRASSAEADGYIKPGEYDDALKIDLSNATWEGYLYAKHDGEFLYVFVDHVSDTIHHPAGYDNGWVAIDILGDGGNEPKEDDYLFHSSSHHVWVGEGGIDIPGGQWDELIEHINYSASGSGAFGVSQNSMTPHSLFEIKIPITGWEIEGKTSFGFCVAAGSPGTQGDFLAKVVWPNTAYANFTADFYAGGVRTLDPLVVDPQIGIFPPPNAWGTITLADVELPSKENITVPLAKVVPTPDGFISPGEWDDAEVWVVGTPKDYGYLYVKHNYTFLWVFLDHVTDTVKSPLGWDNGWVAIDPDKSGGSEPREYDILFHSHGHLVYIGDGVDPIEGSQWGILRGHLPEDTPEKYLDLRDLLIASYAGSGPGWGLTDANNETFHTFFELQIPLGILELIPGLGNTTTTLGFCTSMQDHDATTIIDWPVTQSTGNFWPGPDVPGGSYAPPDSWGTLKLGNESLLEKPPLPPPPSKPIYVFEVPWDDKVFQVVAESNSTLSDFYFNQPTKEIGFNVTGSCGTIGFCNVTIPVELLDGAFMVLIDDANTFYMLTRNETHTFLYFLYSHSTHSVQIIGTIAVPEFSAFIVTPLFMIAISVAVILAKTIRLRAKSKAHLKPQCARMN